MSATKRSASLADEVGERGLLPREGLRGVSEWEADAGRLTSEECAAGEALLDRLLSGSGEPPRP